METALYMRIDLEISARIFQLYSTFFIILFLMEQVVNELKKVSEVCANCGKQKKLFSTSCSKLSLRDMLFQNGNRISSDPIEHEGKLCKYDSPPRLNQTWVQ